MICRRDNGVEITDASWGMNHPDFVLNALQRMGISRTPTLPSERWVVQRFMAGSHDDADDSETRPSLSGRANPLSKDFSVAYISYLICASGALRD